MQRVVIVVQRFKRLIILHSCRLSDNTKRRIEDIEYELREAQNFEFRNLE